MQTETNGQKLDHYLLLDYLSHWAQVFFTEGRLSQEQADLFKIKVSTFSFKETSGSLLKDLWLSEDHFLNYLTIRYGLIHFFLNVQFFTQAHPIKLLCQNLFKFSETVLDATRKNFNTVVWLNSEPVLYGHMLTFISAQIAQIGEDLMGIMKENNKLYSHALPYIDQTELQLDEKFAELVQKKEVDYPAFPELSESLSRRKLNSILKNSLHLFSRLISDLFSSSEMHNESMQIIGQLEMYTDRLEKLNIQKNSDFSCLESRRLELVHLLYQFNNGLEQVLPLILLELDRLPDQLLQKETIPQNVQRALWINLLEQEVPAKEAHHAVCEVTTYCQANKVRPDQLLADEFYSLHPSLTEKSYETLLLLTGKKVSEYKGLTNQKSNILDKSDKVRQTIQQSLKLLTYLLLVTILTKCGIKLAPKSDSVDLRPEIPFQLNEVDSSEDNEHAKDLPKSS